MIRPLILHAMKYFDPIKRQLIYEESVANSGFWDSHWKIDEDIKAKIRATRRNFVTVITKKYLVPRDGVILEGGCGNAINVSALVNNGYKCIGLDYAENTVSTLNQLLPELDIRFGDVTKLPFSDCSFAGYWSWGVIEHFWDGYEDAASEMSRVIRKDGYLFLAFPFMSVLRRMKARFGLYEIWNRKPIKDFYQFILSPGLVIGVFEKYGFKLVQTLPFGGIKGLKTEVDALRPMLQRLYYCKGSSVCIRLLKKSIDLISSPIAGHMLLLVFKKS